MTSIKSEASWKSRKIESLQKAVNRGDLFEALDLAKEMATDKVKEAYESGEALEECEKILAQIVKRKADMDKIGADAAKASIKLLHSDEVTAAEKDLKAIKDTIKDLYTIFGDLDKSREMVITYKSQTSKSAATLEGGQSAIDATAQELKDGGVKDDEDLKEIISATTSSMRKSNDAAVKKLTPILEQAKDISLSIGDAADAVVPADQFRDLLAKFQSVYDELDKATVVITTTFSKLSGTDIATIPEESKTSEGLLDKLKGILTSALEGITGLITRAFDGLFDLQDDMDETMEACDEAASIMNTYGFELPRYAEESKEHTLRDRFEALAKSVDGVCEKALKDHPELGDFIDEMLYVKNAAKEAGEAMDRFAKTMQDFKAVADVDKSEDKLELISILADAIMQVTNSDGGDEESEESEEPTMGDRVSREYEPEGEDEQGLEGEPVEET